MSNDMEQNNKNKIKLKGIQRLQLTRIWLKNGREGYKEDFIKKVCAAKGIEYVPPPIINHRHHDYKATTVDSPMFPKK